jgi:DNA invertase Pin-like site-specific DNA recombinase
MLGMFAEFETAIKSARRKASRLPGRLRLQRAPPSIKLDAAAALAEGLGATEIDERLKIGRASVYRVRAS